MKTPVLIAGAGLSGLSCARFLYARGRPVLLVERENEVGGLCRSVARAGFTFDYTGHFLHFKNPGTRRWVLRLPGLILKERRRHAAVYSQGVTTEYPYQENNAGLPPETIVGNVRGYLEAVLLSRFHGKTPDPSLDFPTFCRRAFGEGVTRQFMEPYNAKLWKTPLDRLTARWMGRFVPKARVREVVEGALRARTSDAGYNATFLYPAQGGIQALPRALARGLPPPIIRLRTALMGLDLGKRVALLSDGTRVRFDALVSSLPLPRLAALTRDLPASLRRLATGLKSVSILNVNLGFSRPSPTPYSWVYFPEKSVPFHRAGCLSACVPEAAPRGASSIYVEISYVGKRPNAALWGRKTLRALKDLGWIKGEKDLAVRVDLDLPGAYVVYDQDRERIVPALLDYFSRRGVLSVGRWGRWEYGSMESALEQGQEAAERLL